MAPAGALAASGADMGRFMIAHLNHTLAQSGDVAAHVCGRRTSPFPALPAMALGFYHEDRNGLNIVGHGGDTVFFHSDLHLFLDKNVGLYISMNSIGKDGAAHALREELLQAVPRSLLSGAAAKPADRQHREGARRGDVGTLCQQPRGRVQLPSPGIAAWPNHASPSTRTAIWSFRPSPARPERRASGARCSPGCGRTRKAAITFRRSPTPHGHVKMFSITPYAPIIEFVPAPATLNAGWIFPVGGARAC